MTHAVVSNSSNNQSATNPELRAHWLAQIFGSLYASERGPFVASRRRLLVRVVKHLEGGEMLSMTLRVVMADCHGVLVAEHSYGCFDPIRFLSGTRIGRYVSVGPEVAVYRRNHPLDRLSLHPYFYRPEVSGESLCDVETTPLFIDDGAWVGARAILLPGCRRIGQGAVIAAGAVVTKDVPDYAVVAGNPARIIKQRFDETAQRQAEGTGWWQLTPDEVRARYQVNLPWGGTSAEAHQ